MIFVIVPVIMQKNTLGVASTAYLRSLTEILSRFRLMMAQPTNNKKNGGIICCFPAQSFCIFFYL